MSGVPDAIEVTNVLYRYAELMDLGDFEAVADLLSDCVITIDGVEGRRSGRDAILAMYVDWTRRYEDGTPRSRHLVSNPIVDLDTPTATATVRSSYTVFQQTDVLALQPIMIGRYHDTFGRIPAGSEPGAVTRWRFTHRHLFTDLMGDLSQHLLHGLG